MGSSLKLCLVIAGGAHLYPRFGPTMEWDTAAAHSIVEEAGGLFAISVARNCFTINLDCKTCHSWR